MTTNQEQRHAYYDHDFYVIGFIEGGKRHLWCKGREYDLKLGDLVLFHPRDNHYCAPDGEEPLDYRAVNIGPGVMLAAAREMMGKDAAPYFMQNVVYQSEASALEGGRA